MLPGCIPAPPLESGAGPESQEEHSLGGLWYHRWDDVSVLLWNGVLLLVSTTGVAVTTAVAGMMAGSGMERLTPTGESFCHVQAVWKRNHGPREC